MPDIGTMTDLINAVDTVIDGMGDCEGDELAYTDDKLVCWKYPVSHERVVIIKVVSNGAPDDREVFVASGATDVARYNPGLWERHLLRLAITAKAMIEQREQREQAEREAEERAKWAPADDAALFPEFGEESE